MEKFILKEENTDRYIVTVIFTLLFTSSISFILEGFTGAWINFVVFLYLYIIVYMLMPELTFSKDYKNLKLLHKFTKENMLVRQELTREEAWEGRIYRKYKVKKLKKTTVKVYNDYIQIYRGYRRIADSTTISGSLTKKLTKELLKAL
jgi:hypothetical protein